MRTLWQRVTGWAALTAAAVWAAKFTLLSAAPDAAVTKPFVGFLAPTLGSLLGIVAATGVALPLLAGRRWWMSVPVCAVTAFATVAAAGLLGDASNVLLRESASRLVRVEGSILVAAAFWSVVAVWLLRPAVSAGAVGALLLAGGASWTTVSVSVASGAALSGWVVSGYQLGLWAFVLAGVALTVRAVRHRHAMVPVLLVGAYVLAGVLGAAPVLSGELGLLLLGLTCITLGCDLLRSGARHVAPA